MRYVGYSEFYHDAGLAISNEDGTVEFATHGERYSKKKNDANIPDVLWDMINDDDHVSFYEDHVVKFDIRGGVEGTARNPESISFLKRLNSSPIQKRQSTTHIIYITSRTALLRSTRGRGIHLKTPF